MSSTLPVRAIGVGIDTARYGHCASFLRDDGQEAAKSLSFAESRQGYAQFQRTLERLAQRYPGVQFYFRLDAAGQYAANLEAFLRQLPFQSTLSVGQPTRNENYRKVHFPKRKSDNTDSFACARFAVIERPAPTPAVSVQIAALREVASRLEAQARQSTRFLNQLHNLLSRAFPELVQNVSELSRTWVLKLLAKYPTPEKLARAQETALAAIPRIKLEQARALQQVAANSIASLRGPVAAALVRQQVATVQNSLRVERRLRELLVTAYQKLPYSGHVQLETIPGIGPFTAAALAAKIECIDHFLTPEHLVGYFGIFPQESTSGVDRNGRPLPAGTMRMSPQGNDLVRKCLWNAAKTATLHNPPVRELYCRLRHAWDTWRRRTGTLHAEAAALGLRRVEDQQAFHTQAATPLSIRDGRPLKGE